jgi:hypothetical protein
VNLGPVNLDWQEVGGGRFRAVVNNEVEANVVAYADGKWAINIGGVTVAFGREERVEDAMNRVHRVYTACVSKL